MNTNGKTKKISISQGVLFVQRHPALIFLLLIGCFFVVPSVSFAATESNIIVQGAIYLLYYVYLFCSYLVSLAATLFLWTIDTGVFSGLLNNGAVYEVWVVVRDFLNIFFILVLLFAAFATIFQLDRYEYKKTLPMLVLMALLVNFSFPVSRVVIDLANVPMYFFAQNVFATTDINIVQSVLGGSQIQKIILPNITSASDAASNASFPQMLAGVICMFLFGASFLVLAVLMLVRIIALTILVMFSPIGFVGMITPALQSFAKGWWDKLFKWAFYGPIAVMFVLVAIIVMKVGSNVQSAHAMKNLTGDQGLSTFISNMAFFTIPIVLFWIAITSTEKYSNDISGLGIKWGSNLGRWMGRKGWHMPITYPLKQTGISGGMKQAWQDRMAALGFGKDALASRERKWAARVGGDAARTRLDQENKKLVDEASKKKNMVDLSPDELKNIVASGTKHEKVAALTELAGRGLASAGDLNDVRKLFGVDSQVTRTFEAKMRAFDPVSVFTDINGKLNEKRLESFAGSGQVDWKKISDKSLTPELLQYAFKAKTISNKDLDELRSKGTEYTNAIKKNLDVAIESIDKENGGKWDLTNDIQRSIQSAYLAQTGKFHATIERTPDSSFMKTDASGVTSVASRAEAKGDLLARADVNTLKRMDKSFIDSSPAGIQNMTVLVEKMSAGKYAEIITEMEKSGVAQAAVAKDINDYMRSLTGATGNAARLKDIADKDHRLAHLR